MLAAAECYDELRYGTPGTAGVMTHAETVDALSPLLGTVIDRRIAVVPVAAAESLVPTAPS